MQYADPRTDSWPVLNETGMDSMRGYAGGRTARRISRMLIEKARLMKRQLQWLFNFIRYIEYLQKQNGDFGEVNITGENENTVRIMSIHKSKRSGIPVVFRQECKRKFNLRDINSGIIAHPDYVARWTPRPEQRTRIPTLLEKRVIRHQLLDGEPRWRDVRVLWCGVDKGKGETDLWVP